MSVLASLRRAFPRTPAPTWIAVVPWSLVAMLCLLTSATIAPLSYVAGALVSVLTLVALALGTVKDLRK